MVTLMDGLLSRLEDDPAAVMFFDGQVAALKEGAGMGRREVVGLLMEVNVGGGNVITGTLLNNVAPAGTAQFRIAGDEVHGVFQQLKNQGAEVNEIVLWHSHHGPSGEPSRHDVDNFPEWLCKRALVYHVPAGTSRVYDGSAESRRNIGLSDIVHRTSRGI